VYTLQKENKTEEAESKKARRNCFCFQDANGMSMEAFTVVSDCEHGNEHSGSTKGGGFPE
jgi:hypothetical protein